MKPNNDENQNSKNISADFPDILKRGSIGTVVTIPLIVGFVELIISNWVGQKIYGKQVPAVYETVSAILCFLICSISGFAQIVRREGPGVLGIPAKGFWPILMGSVWVIFTWILALILFVDLIIKL